MDSTPFYFMLIFITFITFGKYDDNKHNLYDAVYNRLATPEMIVLDDQNRIDVQAEQDSIQALIQTTLKEME